MIEDVWNATLLKMRIISNNPKKLYTKISQKNKTVKTTSIIVSICLARVNSFTIICTICVMPIKHYYSKNQTNYVNRCDFVLNLKMIFLKLREMFQS
jgi:hypothetical protein